MANRRRTASQALYQLSYAPVGWVRLSAPGHRQKGARGGTGGHGRNPGCHGPPPVIARTPSLRSGSERRSPLMQCPAGGRMLWNGRSYRAFPGAARAEKGAVQMSELVEYKGNSLAAVEEPGGLAAHGGGDGGADAAGGHPGGAFASPARHSRMAVAVVAASILAAVAVGAAVFGGGTSGSTGNGSAAAHGTLAASASNSAAAPSVDFTLSATQTGAGSQRALLTGNGSFDLAHGVGQMTATIPALSSIVGGGTSDSVTLISDGTNVYLNLPALSSFLHGTTWFETSLARFAKQA